MIGQPGKLYLGFFRLLPTLIFAGFISYFNVKVCSLRADENLNGTIILWMKIVGQTIERACHECMCAIICLDAVESLSTV